MRSHRIMRTNGDGVLGGRGREDAVQLVVVARDAFEEVVDRHI